MTSDSSCKEREQGSLSMRRLKSCSETGVFLPCSLSFTLYLYQSVR